MSEPCITCGGEVGPLDPALRRAKERLNMPLTPPKRCPKCVWSSLLKLANDPDDEPSQATSGAGKDE